MTKKELSQLYYLNREIEQEKEELAKLEAAATSNVQTISGLPHLGGIADKTAIAAEIADCKTIIEANKVKCVAEYNRLLRYIATIDDSLMRQIIKLRHVNGLSWFQVAQHIGGGNTADSVRMAHDRFVSE